MRKTLLLLVLAESCRAAISNLSVTETTATQAILKYQAPDSNACTVEVSQNANFVPLVNDVDPAKFAQANSDSRPGNIRAGAERFFVIGKRAAEVGIGGSRYSRALQAFTLHYYRVTCPGPGNTTSGTFKTMNIPFGNNYAEPEPVDRKMPGVLAHPHISLSDRTEEVVDPQTGMLLKRLSAANDTYVNIDGAPFTIARSTNWQNLGNLTSQDGRSSSISASNSPLFLAIKTNTNGQAPYTEYITSYAAAYTGRPHGAWGYYQAHLIAAVNNGGAAPANPEDAKLIACLTINGVTCYDGADQYEKTLGTSFSDVALGTKSSGDLWQKPGNASTSWPEQGTRTGFSMCDGSTRVKLASGEYYAPNWVPGSAIQVNGADYTISFVPHTREVSVTTNCPSNFVGTGAYDANDRIFRTSSDRFTSSQAGQLIYIKNANGPEVDLATTIDQVIDARTVVTRDLPPVRAQQLQFGYPVNYAASNFGVLLRKKTNSTDTISIDYGYVNYEMDFHGSFTVGGVKLCSDFTVIGPNGKPGYNCQTPAGNLYWVDAESGEAHLFGNLNTEPNRGCGSDQQLFSASNPDQYWCSAYGPLYATTYYGDHSEPIKVNGTGTLRIFQPLPNCNTSPPNAPPYTDQQPCIVSELYTPGTDIPSLAQAFTANPDFAPQFEKTKFTLGRFKDIDENGNLIFAYTRGSGFVLGWLVVFNPTATTNVEGGRQTGATGNFGCVGGGRPGCIVAAIPTWARSGCRWCTYKEGSSPFPGWINTYTYTWTNSSPGSGPYYVPVINGAANGTGNVLDNNASLTECPPNAFGAVGRRCTVVTVGSEPLSPAHGAGETGLPGEAGPAMLGDRFATEVAFPSHATEQAMLIKKEPGTAAGTWIYTLYRDINHTDQGGHRYAVTGANPNLYTVCAANPDPANQSSAYAWLWNFIDDPHGMNRDGTTIPGDYINWNDHQFWSHGNFVVNQNYSIDSRCRDQNCYGTRLWGNRPFAEVVTQPKYSAMISSSPKWGSEGGAVDYTNLQSHVTSGGSAASPERFPYFFDGRPYRGGYSSGSPNGTGSSPAVQLGGTLFKFSRAAMPNIQMPFQKVFPTAAFSGRYPLVNISSPAKGDVIGTGPADNFKYCIASIEGECRAGSAVGDTYFNVPHLLYGSCFQAAQNLNLSDEQDICIGGSPPIRDAIVQVGLTESELDGRTTRVLTKFTAPRVLSVFWTPNVLPNGKWMIFEAQFPGDGSANKALMLGKIPPPGQQDKLDRTTFIPITFRIPAHANSTAFVRFGYAENGDPGTFFCTDRSENCVSARQTETPADANNPFYFEQTERQSYQPVECSNGCQITVSGIPQRVMYYQVVYTDRSGTTTQTPTLATVVP